MENGKSDTLEAIIRAAKKMTMKKAEQPEAEIEKHPTNSYAEHGDIDKKTNDIELNIEPETDDILEISEVDNNVSDSVMDGFSQEFSAELQVGEEDIEHEPEENGETANSTLSGAVASGLPTSDPSDAPIDLEHVSVHFLEFAIAFLTLAKCQYQSDTNVKVNSLSFFTLVALDNWAAEDYTMSELAEKLQITKQQFSRLINDLEEKGFVERIHDKTNRRRVYIRICDLGRAMMDDLKENMLNTTLSSLRSYSVSELAELDFCICRLTKLMQKFNTESE